MYESEACSLAEQGDFVGAVRCFKKAVAVLTTADPGSSHVFEMMAQCMMEIGDSDEAVIAASKAITIDPQVPNSQIVVYLYLQADKALCGECSFSSAVAWRFPHPGQGSKEQRGVPKGIAFLLHLPGNLHKSLFHLKGSPAQNACQSLLFAVHATFEIHLCRNEDRAA